MKILLFIFFNIFFITTFYAQVDEENIISYYAVSNSLDGQPMIDMMNKLRFFPVFAMYEKIDTVIVTLYYGPNIYRRQADEFEYGRYWELLLPNFNLGEAIQRIEVEVKFELDKSYNEIFEKKSFETEKKLNDIIDSAKIDSAKIANIFKDLKLEVCDKLEKFEERINNSITIFVNNLTELNNRIETLSKSLSNLDSLVAIQKDSLIIKIKEQINLLSDGLTEDINADIKKIFQKISDTSNALIQTQKEDLISKINEQLNVLSKNFNEDIEGKVNDSFQELKNKTETISNDLSLFKVLLNTQGEKLQGMDSLKTQLKKEIMICMEKASINFIYELTIVRNKIDSVSVAVINNVTNMQQLKEQIASSIEAGLSDTNYIGQSVRKSDLIISEDFTRARLLYRNYKGSLRHMPALDPAERLGIFRIRYVPFPIVGTKSSPRMNRIPFSGNNAHVVFEIGLAFGDAIVPGDEFVVPEFSFKRLGFAIAITEQLFADSAEIIGLALTYDFNSYGSIGIGGNFAQDEVHGYASFGINKKAFEALLSAIAGIFK